MVKDEKRSFNYTFTKMKDLINFFKAHFAEDEIKAKIAELKKGFVVRPQLSKKTNRLQFIKKCEWALSRELKSERI